ncbi:MAG: Secretion system C-terminal sorting domain [Bacteroidota bacterium]
MTCDKTNVSAGETFTVKVKVTDFTKILSMQYLTLYNSGDYKLDTMTSSAITLLKSDYNDNNGSMGLSWIASALATGLTFPDNTTLYEMHFHALQATSVNNICFSENISTIAFEISYYLSSANPWSDVVKGSFTGLGCGFAWAKTAAGYTITGINDAPYNTIKITTYPNPTDNLLHFDLVQNQATDIQLDFFDLQGKKVQHLEKMLPNNAKTLDVPTETLATGTYIYRLTTQEGVATGKFTKI